MPPVASGVRARFVEGSPDLKALIAGVPQSICLGLSAPCYLQDNGQTVTSLLFYGSFTSFVPLAAGKQQLVAFDTLGDRVGPLTSAALSPGKRYTLVIVGSYPKYRVLTFEEPAASTDARISLYEASPSVADAGFGTFNTKGHRVYNQAGSANFGNVATVSLGKSVVGIGGYAGKGSKPFSCPPSRGNCSTITLKQLSSFDRDDALPFHNVTRLSLFLFDPTSTAGPVFGSLDK